MRKTGFENHRLRTLIWIVRKLQEYRQLTLREINDLWQDDTDISAGKEIERRTFLNYINAIRDMFKIYIECNKRNDFKYYIDEDRSTPVIKNMMDNFEQSMALGTGIEMNDRILFDKAPEGIVNLEKIISAMKSSRNVSFQFHPFDDEPFDVSGAPYCIKRYQQRWYVVIRWEDGFKDTYSLDRIVGLHIEKTKFKMDKDFNAQDFFRYSFGVRVNQDDAPSTVKLKVASQQCPYFRSLPLHPSQQEIETTDDYSIFTIEVVPTIELTMKLLSYGFLVEVLEPQNLRQTVMTEVASVYHKYFENSQK